MSNQLGTDEVEIKQYGGESFGKKRKDCLE